MVFQRVFRNSILQYTLLVTFMCNAESWFVHCRKREASVVRSSGGPRGVRNSRFGSRIPSIFAGSRAQFRNQECSGGCSFFEMLIDSQSLFASFVHVRRASHFNTQHNNNQKTMSLKRINKVRCKRWRDKRGSRQLRETQRERSFSAGDWQWGRRTTPKSVRSKARDSWMRLKTWLLL